MKQWKDNAVKIMKALVEIVENKGGRVNPTCKGQQYISFVLNGVKYYYQTDENPFFDFYYSKTPILKSETYSQDACLEIDKQEWVFDNLLKEDISESDVVECAAKLFIMLYKAPLSFIKPDYECVRIQNTYGNGYHTEKVRKERVAKLDF